MIKNYQKEFDRIYEISQMSKKIKEHYKKRETHICTECNEYKFLDLINDMFVCPSCGITCVANISNHSYNDTINRRFDKVYSEHYIKRLNSTLEHMGIDKKYKVNILKYFYKIVDYFINTKPNGRRNIFKYEYSIIKILEVEGKFNIINYDYMPKIVTLRKYDIIWADFCKNIGITFIPSFQHKNS